MSHEIFISYAAENRAVAMAMCEYLEKKGIGCWIAPRDIVPGMDFTASIIQGIKKCRLMILVFSSYSNTSPHVLREMDTAVKSNIPIIPFRVENIDPSSGMEFYIGIPQWLDAYEGSLEEHLERLYYIAIGSPLERGSTRFASITRRGGAFIIDYIAGFVLGILGYALVHICGLLIYGDQKFNSMIFASPGNNTAFGDMLVVTSIIFTLVLYFIFTEMPPIGRTIGKFICKIQVISIEEAPLSIFRILIRGVLKCIPFYLFFFIPELKTESIFFIVHIVIFLLIGGSLKISPTRQAFYDKIAKTVVVTKK